MAVIDRVDRSSLSVDTTGLGDFFGDLLEDIRSSIRDEVWNWYDDHMDDVILEIKVAWVFKVQFRVRHAAGLIESIIGTRN